MQNNFTGVPAESNETHAEHLKNKFYENSMGVFQYELWRGSWRNQASLRHLTGGKHTKSM